MSKRILLVEDQEDNRQIIRDMLAATRPLPRTSFHHQPEAQHPKSSAIHKKRRPITPSLGH
jgi:CheY-like chemotaxis protein